MDPVAQTSLLVAAIRAQENDRPDRLFADPFARQLAGPEGQALLERYRGNTGGGPIIEVRTRYYDDHVLQAIQHGVKQVVILAAGMDSRAFRLPWAAGTRLFELDRPEIFAHKNAALGSAQPRCERKTLPADLSTDWTVTLLAAGFDSNQPTLWLVEGLLQYLEPAVVPVLVQRVTGLSAPGSVLLYDVIARALLEAPAMQPMLATMAKMGAAWKFGAREPGEVVAPLGWNAEAVDPAVFGQSLGRWPAPLPGAPARAMGWFARASR